jgi:hypothetical protein
VHANRDLECWRNGGLSFTSVEYWNPMGIVWTAAGKGVDARSLDEMRLVDINGDFKSDVLWVDNQGRVTTWINQRGSGRNMVPHCKSQSRVIRTSPSEYLLCVLTTWTQGKELGSPILAWARMLAVADNLTTLFSVAFSAISTPM